jgi:hypothetical protein
MKRRLQTAIFLLCVAFSVAAVYNVLADNADVEAMASAAACAGEGTPCNAQKTRMERTPLGQTFDMVTPKKKVEIRCARSLFLVGDYTCAVR